MSEIEIPWLSLVSFGLSCWVVGWSMGLLFAMPRTKKEKK